MIYRQNTTFWNIPDQSVFYHMAKQHSKWVSYGRVGIEQKCWHERQHWSSGNDVFKHNEISTVG